ncbi:aromatic amino acid aminotransferase [Sphingomonas sp. Leaf407]|uniref:amino acid aminotransferase n=1 Tax=unclassified Sphingomonas TaxID=196159 RepID=UPI0006FAB95C|nr:MULTISPECIES: aromatic amino acid transaminase [unclassified Sphingomonas]KQN35628.1 aromatic amino acid aminotransferase [Sphingomonas sp. Leaf42]KQT26495.1 aromatic amino acid aminotransferase [Sphingomonas sp. Leaf407]
MPFRSLVVQPADSLLRLIGAYRADPRAHKIDLGVGVFRDDAGHTPVMLAVKQAEMRLIATQDSKAYLGPEGDKGFTALLEPLVFGDTLPADRRCGLQTPGGTGALRLGAELLAKAGVRRILVGQPSWANHAPVFAAAGLTVVSHAAFDMAAQRIDLPAMRAAIGQAEAGDAILLHGCCHNPTGIDPDAGEWRAIADAVADSRLIPFVDLAYQGLGDGMEADALGTRTVLGAVSFGIVAYSCDKNFGLYRERTGALWVSAPDADHRDVVLSNLLALARANWSMPPDHGAATVRIVLEDEHLAADWRGELDGLRGRLQRLRAELAAIGQAGSVDLAPLAQGKGMFATLPLSPGQIEWLRATHGIYMAGSGRINIAGFAPGDIARFGEALVDLGRAGVS